MNANENMLQQSIEEEKLRIFQDFLDIWAKLRTFKVFKNVFLKIEDI